MHQSAVARECTANNCVRYENVRVHHRSKRLNEPVFKTFCTQTSSMKMAKLFLSLALVSTIPRQSRDSISSALSLHYVTQRFHLTAFMRHQRGLLFFLFLQPALNILAAGSCSLLGRFEASQRQWERWHEHPAFVTCQGSSPANDDLFADGLSAEGPST